MATSTITEPTAAGQTASIPFVGADPGDKSDGDTLREAITRINNRIKEIYGAQNSGGVVQTPFIDNDNIKDNAVDHDELANRYSAVVTKTDTSGTGGSAVDISWDDGAVFNFQNSLTGAIELKFDGYKAGQVIDIYGLTGSQTVTLNSTASGNETFNKVGGVSYDGSSSNLIQVVCVDDSASTPVFNYAIATYTPAQP